MRQAIFFDIIAGRDETTIDQTGEKLKIRLLQKTWGRSGLDYLANYAHLGKNDSYVARTAGPPSSPFSPSAPQRSDLLKTRSYC